MLQDDLSDDGKMPPSMPPPQLAKGLESGVAKSSANANTLNLGMAQIIVTAATPMVEDGADKSFPPVGESEKSKTSAASDKQQQEQQQEQEEEEKPESKKQPVMDKKPNIVPKPTAKVLQQKQRSSQPGS